MPDLILKPLQSDIVNLPLSKNIFIRGEAGRGKTTAAVARLQKLLSTIPGQQILIFIPQRNLGMPYQDYLTSSNTIPGGLPSILTIGGFARRMVDLFWPSIFHETSYRGNGAQPHFLSMETAEYCMGKVIDPLLEKGFFQSIVIEKHRLYSQILDNLNKSAIVQFPISEIGERLKSVNQLDASLKIAFDQVQICAEAYRNFLIENNLIDYSLLLELFTNHIYNKDFFQSYFHRSFKAIIADNIEEDIPLLHKFIATWLPSMDSVTLVYDEQGGYRSFLGADPKSALDLCHICDEQFDFSSHTIQPESMRAFTNQMSTCIQKKKLKSEDASNLDNVLTFADFHFYPEMIKAACLEIENIIQSDKVPPNEIVVLSPYLSDSLNFSLTSYLKQIGVPSLTTRPSRKYLDDAVIRSVLTLSKIAHWKWGLKVSSFEFRNMLLVCIPEIDVVRADLITQTLFKRNDQEIPIGSFDKITNTETRKKITYQYGERINFLKQWLISNQSIESQTLDVFISRLYGEVLSQPGFALAGDFSSADRISKLLASIRVFRSFAAYYLNIDQSEISIEYIRNIEKGLLPSAIYEQQEEPTPSVLIAPAHTFLMQNRMATYQFWLDIGSMGWWERLNQPLTNPYLLSRFWTKGHVWTISDEYDTNQSSMLRIIKGLLNRCSKHVYAYSVHTNEHGTEQRGPLLKAFQSLQKQHFLFDNESNV